MQLFPIYNTINPRQFPDEILVRCIHSYLFLLVITCISKLFFLREVCPQRQNEKRGETLKGSRLLFMSLFHLDGNGLGGLLVIPARLRCSLKFIGSFFCLLRKCNLGGLSTLHLHGLLGTRGGLCNLQGDLRTGVRCHLYYGLFALGNLCLGSLYGGLRYGKTNF